MRQLVASTSEAYGDMGLFEPAHLARIDFLHHPELLVELVLASKEEPSRQGRPELH